MTSQAPSHAPSLLDAVQGIADDYMTSEHHHPGYVLIPTAKFEEIRSALSIPSKYLQHTEGVEAEIASVVQSVNEWDDRTSPDDYPDHLLITSEELADILRNFVAALSPLKVEGPSVKAWTQADAERENAAFHEWWRKRGYDDFPDLYTLTCQNAMHAAWQEAAERSTLVEHDETAERGEKLQLTLTRILGTYGCAYDPPGPHRAYTYEHQPANDPTYRLGKVASMKPQGGDQIDYGLHLLKALQENGFGVFEIEPASPPSPYPAIQKGE